MQPNTIIILHGFNSGPGNKANVIDQYLSEKSLHDDYGLIAPQLSSEPRKAISEINRLIRQHKTGKVHIIGTSLGGFYATFFRAKLKDDYVIVHAINPSWNPSQTLIKHLNKELVNFKTNEKWIFKKEFAEQFIELENYVWDELKQYKGSSYSLHLAQKDVVLDFKEILSYLKEYQVPCKLFYYDTNHRFEKMEEMLRNCII